MGKREIGLSIVIAAVIAFAATLELGTTRIVAYCIAGIGVALIAWDSLEKKRRRGKGKPSKHPKTELAIVHKGTSAEIKGYGFPFNDRHSAESGYSGLMDVTCVCYVSVPESLPTVQLLSGVARFEIDGTRYNENVRINQTIVPWNTDDYRIPPFVEAGETLQIDVCFFGKVRWDNGWIVPNDCSIRKLVLVDQFKKRHLLKEEIPFHVSWTSSASTS
jgi:hypothetical protein